MPRPPTRCCSSCADTERAARARVPRRDRAGPAPKVDRLVQATLVAHRGDQRNPQQPAHRLRRDPGPAAAGDEVPRRRRLRKPVGHPRGRGDTRHRQCRDQYDVVAAADRLVDHRVPVPGQVDDHRVEAAPAGREHLAHRERLERRRPIGGPGQHRELPGARQRLAQRPRAQPAGGLQHRVPADPVGVLQPEHPVDACADRVGVDQQRPPGVRGHLRHGGSEDGRARSTGATDHTDRHAGCRTSVADIGEQLHQPGLRGRQTGHRLRAHAERVAEHRVPDRRTTEDMHSLASRWARRRECRRDIRTDEHHRSAGPQPDGVGRVAHDLRHDTRGCTQAMDIGDEQRVGRDEERGSHIHAPMVRRLPGRGRSVPGACGHRSRVNACGREMAICTGESAILPTLQP